MALFVSDTTARNILRGMIREVAARTPSIADIKRKATMAMLTSRNSDKMRQTLMHHLREYSPSYTRGTKTHFDMITCELPTFREGEYGLEFAFMPIKIMWWIERKQCVVEHNEPHVIFTPHLFERVFQRGKMINWDEVRSELGSTAMFVRFWALLGADIKQVAIPSITGIYFGTYHVENGHHVLRMRTFVGEPQLRKDQLEYMKYYFTIIEALKMQFEKPGATVPKMMFLMKHAGELLITKFPWLREEYQYSNA